LLHQFTAVTEAAKRVLGAAAETLPTAGRVGTQLVADASLGLLALLAATILSVYKPLGRTPFGWRAQGPNTLDGGTTRGRVSFGFKSFIALVGGIIVTLVLVHLTGVAGHIGNHGL
jgi:hypothetical protein